MFCKDKLFHIQFIVKIMQTKALNRAKCDYLHKFRLFIKLGRYNERLSVENLAVSMPCETVTIYFSDKPAPNLFRKRAEKLRLRACRHVVRQWRG